MASPQKTATLTLYQQYTECHAARMFQIKESIFSTQFVSNVITKIFYYELSASITTFDSSTMNKILLIYQQKAL
jgi:hypothetical protein